MHQREGVVLLTATPCERRAGLRSRWRPTAPPTSRAGQYPPPTMLAVTAAATFSLTAATRSSLRLYCEPAGSPPPHACRGRGGSGGSHSLGSVAEAEADATVEYVLQFESPAEAAQFKAAADSFCAASGPDGDVELERLSAAVASSATAQQSVVKLMLRRDPAAGYGLSLSEEGALGQERVVVRAVSVPGPAAEAGVCVGDQVLAVDGERVAGLRHPMALGTVNAALAKVPQPSGGDERSWETAAAVVWEFGVPRPAGLAPLLEGFKAQLVRNFGDSSSSGGGGGGGGDGCGGIRTVGPRRHVQLPPTTLRRQHLVC